MNGNRFKSLFWCRIWSDGPSVASRSTLRTKLSFGHRAANSSPICRTFQEAHLSIKYAITKSGLFSYFYLSFIEFFSKWNYVFVILEEIDAFAENPRLNFPRDVTAFPAGQCPSVSNDWKINSIFSSSLLLFPSVPYIYDATLRILS